MLILLVDDEAIILKVVTQLLEVLGHSVLTANSGEEALKLLRSRQGIEVTILDESMPGITGQEVLTELRAFAPKHPVIMSSGHLAVEVDDGRVTQLQKPYRMDQLEAALAAALE